MAYRTLSLIIFFLVFIQLLSGEIHRAKSSVYKSVKRASNVVREPSVDVALQAEMPAKEETGDAATVMWIMQDENFGTYDLWIYSIVGSILVGLSGIMPLLILPIESGPSLKHGAPAARLKLMLSFAVGSLLGDVFCHLLPEVWAYMDKGDHKAHTHIGLLVIGGLLFFLVVEKLLGDETEFEPLEDTCEEIDSTDLEIQSSKKNDHSQPKTGNPKSKSSQKNNQSQRLQKNLKMQLSQNKQSQAKKIDTKRKSVQRTNQPLSEPANKVQNHSNHNRNGFLPSSPSHVNENDQHIKVSGYLNLFANIVDNFTHGLAVGGSFLVSRRVGLLTTGAILVHEIPHEVGDFAILLRSGFDRWKAAKAQILTATSGVFGAITALSAEEAGEKTAWILAFTSGSFMYIALVTVVPDLLREKHGWESVKQTGCLIFGILCMIFVTYVSG